MPLNRNHLIASALAAAVMVLPAEAQIPNPTTVAPNASAVEIVQNDANGLSIFRVQPVERTLAAVNFFINDGPSDIKFVATDAAHGISGKARVQAHQGQTDLYVKLDHFEPAPRYGADFLTYVLWAISADGRAQNLGELGVGHGKAELKVSTSFQSFGLIVTAEPYFSVVQPSDVVVAQSVPDKHTNGVLLQVNTHYSLLPRGLYASTGGSSPAASPAKGEADFTLAMQEALKAQQVALNVGAGQYSADIASEVAQDLLTAQAPPRGHEGGKVSLVFARQATQRAEDARVSTLHKLAAQRLHDAVQAAIDAQAQTDAARAAQAQAEGQRDQALSAAAQAQTAADQARQAALANQQTAAALRAKLRAQLNAVLETKETARGLIVNVSGVLFDTGKATLKPRAKLSLTKVATILSLYPSLKLEVEGYTDSTGSQELNQKLSDERSQSVANFLTSNGVPSSNLSTLR